MVELDLHTWGVGGISKKHGLKRATERGSLEGTQGQEDLSAWGVCPLLYPQHKFGGRKTLVL